MTKSKRNKIIFLLIFLHLAVTLPLAFYLNVWADEGSTLATTGGGFLHSFNNFYDEKQAPLYFWMLGLWREISDSIFFARLFSIICSVLAIKFFFDLAKRFFNEKTTIFITTVFALHPFLIWASLEIRLYALIVLQSVLLLIFFADGYLETKENVAADRIFSPKKSQIYFILTAIFALYTNYYNGFLLVGFFIALLAVRRWQTARVFFWQMVFVGFTLLPLALIINRQFAGRAAVFQSPRPVLEGARILWDHFLMFVLPTRTLSGAEFSIISAARVWIVRLAILAAILIFVRRREKIGDNILIFGAIALVGNLFLFAVYYFISDEIIALRHASIVFAPVLLFVCSVTIKILPPKAAPVLAVLLAAFFGYSIFTMYPHLAKRGDWARAAAFIEQNEEPKQLIVIFPSFDVLPFRAHYHGVNKILPDEKLVEWGAEDTFGTPGTFTRQIEFVTGKIPPGAETVWLATDESCQTTEACQPLENFIKAHYTIEKDADFYLERVRLLRRKNINDNGN